MEDAERLERLGDLLNQVLSRVATMGPKDTEQEEADKKETEEDKRLAILQGLCSSALSLGFAIRVLGEHEFYREPLILVRSLFEVTCEISLLWYQPELATQFDNQLAKLDGVLKSRMPYSGGSWYPHGVPGMVRALEKHEEGWRWLRGRVYVVASSFVHGDALAALGTDEDTRVALIAEAYECAIVLLLLMARVPDELWCGREHRSSLVELRESYVGLCPPSREFPFH